MTRREEVREGGRAAATPIVVAGADQAEWRRRISSTSSCPRAAAFIPEVEESLKARAARSAAVRGSRNLGSRARCHREGGGGCDDNLTFLLFRA